MSIDETGAAARYQKHMQSAVWRYASFTLVHAIRRWWITREVGMVGEAVFIEPNVKLLRHPENISVGARVMLKEGARLCPTNQDAHITIGEWTTIGHGTFIFASSRIEIGANCLIAPFCYLIDSDHGTARSELIRNQPMTAMPITVGDDVWLGTGAVITKGVVIEQGAIIGARAVVTRDVPAYAVVAGNPAVVIGHRE